MNISDIHLMFDYSYWATKLIMSTAAEVSEEQLKQPTSFSWGSLLGTLVHTMDSERLWRNLLHHNELIVRMTVDDFASLEALNEFWQIEQDKMRAYLNTLTDEDMPKVIRYDIPEGQRERVLWHCLIHMVNHGTQHRSECAVMLTDFGHSPGNIDLTRFLNERG